MNIAISRLTSLSSNKIGPVLWRLISPLRFDTATGPLTVPEGFITDGASCPRLLWSFCSPMSGTQAEAAVMHDFLYSKDSGYGRDRASSDRLFLDAMVANGTGKVRAFMIYSAVRLGGGSSWKKKWSKEKLKGRNINAKK